MSKSSIYTVILAGGQSSRLYPFNKILSDLTSSGRSLIQQAFDRVSFFSRKETYVLSIHAMVVPIRKQLQLPASHFFADPVRRGTWPALLWAMAHLRQKNPDAVMAVVTGDHIIPKVREFRKAFRQAVRIAELENAFVVIPVRPSSEAREWTGFGGIRGDERAKRLARGGVRISGFEEKPTRERAASLIKEGSWAWNAGMFFFRIAVAEQTLEVYQPSIYQTYLKMAEALSRGKSSDAAKIFEMFPEKIPHPFDPKRFVDHTVDYAVMMPLVLKPIPVASAWMTLQSLTKWTDLGQWTALREVVKADRQGNIRIGDIHLGPRVRNSILVADQGHRIEVSDVTDLIISVSAGKALILPVSQVGRIKEMVAASQAKEVIVGMMPDKASFALSKRRNVMILSNRSKETI